jgi:hypothetical protein
MITQKMTQQIVDADKPAQTSPHRRFETPKLLCLQVYDVAWVCLRGKFAGCTEPTTAQGCRFILGRKFPVSREFYEVLDFMARRSE